jgi:hypothetical protein
MVQNAAKTRPKKAPTGRNKVAKKVTGKPLAASTRARITPGERHRRIAEAAYFKAEQHGFSGRDPAQDWYEAEAEIEALLARKRGKPQP